MIEQVNDAAHTEPFQCLCRLIARVFVCGIAHRRDEFHAFQTVKCVADQSDGNACELLDFKYRERRFAVSEAKHDVLHHNKGYLSAVGFTDVGRTYHVFVVVEVLVHVAKFGTKQADIPR